MYNKIVLTGRLESDPNLRHGTDGKPLAVYTLEVDRTYPKPNEPKSDIFRIISFGRQAENDAKYLTRGAIVTLDGRLEFKRYEDSEGIHRTAANLMAEQVRYVVTNQTR